MKQKLARRNALHGELWVTKGDQNNIKVSKNNNMVTSWLLKKIAGFPQKIAGYQNKKKTASWPLAIEYTYTHLYREYFFWLLNEVVGIQNKNVSSQIGPWIKLLATKMKNPGASWPLKFFFV